MTWIKPSKRWKAYRAKLELRLENITRQTKTVFCINHGLPLPDGTDPINETKVNSFPLESKSCVYINTLRPRQNGLHFADDPSKRIFLDETVQISFNISLKFVPKGQIHDISALVHIMAWHRPADKPLSQAMMFRLSTYICVTRLQWGKLSLFLRCSICDRERYT